MTQTLAATLTANGVSPVMGLAPGESLEFAVSGTFVGTVYLEYGGSGTQAWSPARTITSADSGRINGVRGGQWRVRVDNYVSGTIYYSITRTTDAEIASRLRAGSALTAIDLSQIPYWRAARARVKLGTGSGKILQIGDSTDRGRGASGIAVDKSNYSKTIAAYMATLLTAGGVNANNYNIYGDSDIVTGAAMDNRLTVTGAASGTPTGITIGGDLFACNAAGSYSYTPDVQVDKIGFEVTNGSSGNYSLDGAATVPFAGSQVITLTPALGNHTLVVNWTAGVLYIKNFFSDNTAVKSISIANGGWSGAVTGSFLTGGYMADSVALAPDLTIIEGGIINSYRSGQLESVEKATANLQNMITQMKAVGDVALRTPVPTQNTDTPLSIQARYITAMHNLAAINKIPIFDIWSEYGSWEVMNPRGYYFDGVHQRDIANDDIARKIVAPLLYG